MSFPMRVETTPGYEPALKEIKAIGECGTSAMAIEHREPGGGGTYWHLGVVQVPRGVTDPLFPFPKLESEESARRWVTFLGELIARADAAVVAS